MAFIRIDTQKIQLDSGTGGPADGYFYPEDIQMVLAQEGVVSLIVRNAIVGGLDCKIAIGVTEISKDGAVGFKYSNGDIGAIICPPYNTRGEISY